MHSSPPTLCKALELHRNVECSHVVDLGMTSASDRAVFEHARRVTAVVPTKDIDFVHLLECHGPPPRVVLLGMGNLRRVDLIALVLARWDSIHRCLERGEALVEVR